MADRRICPSAVSALTTFAEKAASYINSLPSLKIRGFATDHLYKIIEMSSLGPASKTTIITTPTA
jgi:hypothetical protein